MSVNFFPEGTKNVPAAWTKAAQVEAGNEDASSLNTVTLTAVPTPKLFVQPVHPLFERKACVPADCLPGKGLGRRLSRLGGNMRAAAPGNSSSSDADSRASLSAQPAPAGAVELPDAADSSSKGSSSSRAVHISSLKQLWPFSRQQGSSSGSSSSSGSRRLTSVASVTPGSDDAGELFAGRQLAATCLTTVAVPAGYEVVYNIDGGVDKKATMPKDGPPFISLTTLDTLAPGKHTLNIQVTMLKGTAEVNSVSSMQPAADQVYSTKVTFRLAEGDAAEDEAEPTAEPAEAEPAAKPAAEPAAGAEAPAPAAAEPPAGEVALPARPRPAKTLEEVLPDAVPAVDPKVTQQAVKYYCMRQYNVGGKIHSSKNVTAGDEGANACSVECNALKGDCVGFGLAGNKCFLMKAFNTNSSAADATMDALCMKSANDWLDFGARSAGTVGSGFFCLRGFDLKGDPAGTGDAETPVQVANTEIAGMTPSTCATTCKSTVGCQFMLMKKPSVPGGTATCFLKMHALGGLYGNTGPAPDVDVTCFNGQEAWMTFGGQLDFALPSPEVNTGVETPSVAAVAPLTPGAAGSGRQYRCIKQYAVNGTSAKAVQVSMGDEGLTQCAAKCDEAGEGCVAYVMAETGICSLLSSINFNTSAASPRTYGLCFASPLDWNKFGNPDANGMYCVKNYDFAGDGVRMVDYITITTGAGAVQFCKQQCSAEPQCQFSVTSLGKCYMKNNILSGTFGTTRPDTSVDATCVKGEANWALAALQVSATPAAGPGSSGVNAGMNARRIAQSQQSGAAGARGGAASWVATLLCAAAAALALP